MTEIKPIPIQVSENLLAYMKNFEWQKKNMEEAIGIPKERIGIAYDPIHNADFSNMSKEVFKRMVNDTMVMTRTYFDKVSNRMVTAIINTQKKKRLPRKLKKLVKKRYKLTTTSRYNLLFNHEVLKMSKYYNCKIKREKQ